MGQVQNKIWYEAVIVYQSRDDDAASWWWTVRREPRSHPIAILQVEPLWLAIEIGLGWTGLHWIGLEWGAMKERQKPKMVLILKKEYDFNMQEWDGWCFRKKSMSMKWGNGTHDQGSRNNWNLSGERHAKGKSLGYMIWARMCPAKENEFLSADNMEPSQDWTD